MKLYRKSLQSLPDYRVRYQIKKLLYRKIAPIHFEALSSSRNNKASSTDEFKKNLLINLPFEHFSPTAGATQMGSRLPDRVAKPQPEVHIY